MTNPRTSRRTPGAWLAYFAIAVAIGHHLGTILKPLGTVGPTEWADWVDLLVPLAVLGTAAAALLSVEASRRHWFTFAAGALAYAQGHGIHLAANSVSNAEPEGRALDAAHLWDEVVSHYLWYAGLAVVVLALLLACSQGGEQRAALGPLGWPLALLFGLTWTTNAIEGGTVPLSAAAAVGLLLVARRRPRTAATRAVVVAYGLSLLLLAVWGVWHQGFPQFSELGWI